MAKKLIKKYLYRGYLQIVSVWARLRGKQVVHFLHIGKTAGSSFIKLVKNSNYTKKYKVLCHPHRITLDDLPRSDLFMFFLRNPVTRFRSGFYSRKRKGQPLYNQPWSVNEEIAFGHFEEASDLAAAIISEDPAQREAAIFAMQSISHVKSSFLDWFGSKENFTAEMNRIFYIGFQESYSEDLLNICRILEISYDPEAGNKPVHPNDYSKQRSLTDEEIRGLEAYYKEDVAFYELCRGLKEQLLESQENRFE